MKSKWTIIKSFKAKKKYIEFPQKYVIFLKTKWPYNSIENKNRNKTINHIVKVVNFNLCFKKFLKFSILKWNWCLKSLESRPNINQQSVFNKLLKHSHFHLVFNRNYYSLRFHTKKDVFILVFHSFSLLIHSTLY